MKNFWHFMVTAALLCLCKGFMLAQTPPATHPNLLFNHGGMVYIQKGALLHIQGEMVNDNNITTGEIFNDGIIEVKEHFENKAGAAFKVGADATSTDRAVKFIGNGKQIIKGDLSTVGTASFHNLVIDKVATTDTVEMQTDVAVEGSLVFDNTNTTSAYNPSASFTANGNKGLLKTFSTSEHTLNIANGATDAIAGYAPLMMNTSPETGFVLVRGNKSSALGGLQRTISSTGSYVFPTGTIENGYNAVALHFDEIPAGGGIIKGKFVDGSSNPSGVVGFIENSCANCGTWSVNYTGYNTYFDENPCNSNQPQWITFNQAIENHGYWSFDATDKDQYVYWIEAFPNSFNRKPGSIDENPNRILRYPGDYNFDPSAAAADWGNFVDDVVDINDILSYTANMGCYAGNGIPGGRYKSFSHFSFASSSTGSALPVEWLFIKAKGVNNRFIKVEWATATEINNMGFEVLRSENAVQFTKIGWVDGSGNSTEVNSYHFDDHNVLPDVVYYYKLRQVDFDGEEKQSQIVSAKISGESDFSVGNFFPNPAQNASQIVIQTTFPTKISFSVFDMLGRIVAEGNQEIQAGSNLLNFDVNKLADATYTAVISHRNETYNRRLIITR